MVVTLLWLVSSTMHAQTPVITAQSAGRQVVTVGQNLTLSITATGATSYQWKRNGLAVAGATAASYAITSAVPVRDNGWYQAVVTNGSGSTTSAVVFVNVAVSPANIVAWGTGYAGETTVPAGLSNVVALAAGGYHNLSLKADGTVVAWGDNAYGQTRVPTGLTNVAALAAGGYHSLGLKSDGTVVAWGHNGYGQTTVPTSLTNIVAVAAGSLHSLALKADGTVAAWGEDVFGQRTVPTGLTNVVAIAGGDDHSLALKADGTVVAWGDNFYGQTRVPTGLTNIVAVAGGGRHSLALKADGTVVAWGDSSLGQTTVPTGLTNVVALATGVYHSVALKADGTVVAWGFDSLSATTVPKGLVGGLGLTAGDHYSLVLRDASGDLAPTITTQPLGLSVPVGASGTFTVAATGTPAPTYQWLRNTVALNGETNASLTRASAQLSDAGSYTVVVTNSAGTVTSNVAFLNVVPSGAATMHAVTRSGYVAGGTVTILNTLHYPAGTTSARWRVQLPAGWSYASSDGTAATTMPAVGASGLVEWIWSTPPASPITFSFTLNVPAGTTGALTLTAVSILLVSATEVPVQAQPDPLTVNPAGGKHSADTDGDGQISLAELTRVIELYNARTGTLRTGRYLVATTVTGDGFVTDATNSTAALARYHSADTNRDGRFGLTELTRVIELYLVRSGGTRTGAYRVQAGTEDDFAPGP